MSTPAKAVPLRTRPLREILGIPPSKAKIFEARMKARRAADALADKTPAR